MDTETMHRIIDTHDLRAIEEAAYTAVDALEALENALYAHPDARIGIGDLAPRLTRAYDTAGMCLAKIKGLHLTIEKMLKEESK